ncbi:MAG: hypothetical protein JSR98_21940, partial [Proteobacteria bacterium]|nr:hypothetical protein [Pseudomonadota bacterium]
MRRQVLRAAAVGAAAVTLLGAGAASAADTLSWSTASATTYFCNFTDCGVQPLLVAGHSDSAGTDFNASALVNSPHGTAFAAADAGSTGLLAD